MRFNPVSSLVNKGFRIFNNEEGTTLVEELVSVAVIGIGIVILVAMITTGVIGVRLVDDKVMAESLARSQLELIKDSSYQANPTSDPYPTVVPIPNYSVGVGIEYWNETSSTFGSAVQNDGLQKITITVSSDGNSLIQTAEFKVDR
ncbi:MAG: type II secretion system GspH family protein [Anaerolineales bacterium]|nr:type II secretion system GspH family protein [Anaerolineales bacterium]